MKGKYIYKEIIINAKLDEACLAWTTEEGINSFFAHEYNIDIHPECDFEIFFNPNPLREKKGRWAGIIHHLRWN